MKRYRARSDALQNGATTLTVNQMLSHTHIVYGGKGYNDTYSRAVTAGADNASDYYTRTTSATGGSQSHAHSLSATCT